MAVISAFDGRGRHARPVRDIHRGSLLLRLYMRWVFKTR